MLRYRQGQHHTGGSDMLVSPSNIGFESGLDIFAQRYAYSLLSGMRHCPGIRTHPGKTLKSLACSNTAYRRCRERLLPAEYAVQ